MPIGLIALDVDGTLVEFDSRDIDAADAAAIRASVARGVRVVLASARGVSSLRAYQRLLDIAGPLIAENGAHVVDAEGRDLIHLRMAPEVAARVIRRVLARGLEVAMNVDGVQYRRLRPGQPLGRIEREAHAYGTVTETVSDLLAVIGEGPTSVGVGGAGVAVLLEELKEEPLAAVRYERDGRTVAAVFMHRAASKGNALRALRDALGVGREEVLAIGDAEADVAMFEEAAVGVAVANAPAEVRARATWVAPRLGEAGVAAALERYVLERATR